MLVKLSDAVDIEVVKCCPEGLPAAQDRDPGQAGLEPLEAHLLEQWAIPAELHTPLLVVIPAVLRIAGAPGTAAQPVITEYDDTSRPAHTRWPIASWSSNQTLVGTPLPPL